MKKTALLLGLHCHQPVDNFHEVLDEAIVKSYLPFFEIAAEYPEFRFSVHYSGWLLEYIRDHAPKLFSLMQKLAFRDQVEFLTGGFYEPILASIPSRDRIAQIEKLSAFIETHFSQRPKGLWLTERVWDGSITRDLIACGIEYVIVDDYHFISSGFDQHNLNGYFVTEEEGMKLKLFPINKHLRYQIPFSPEKEPVSYLERIADENFSAGIIFDDGEKFGIWPETFEWVYEKGWLERFIEAILDSDAVEPIRYSDYLLRAKPISLAYLPTTSYFEMGEWSLKAKDALELERIKERLSENFPAETIEKFLKGSIWKNFLVKYYEANHIHKRTIALSNDAKEDPLYLENLYKSQTNDVLWHGVFGGIYLPNLRDNAYRFIIECENLIYKDHESILISDTNCDGYDEIKCVTKEIIAIFDTKNGGQLCELDSRDRTFNYANTLTRYEEAYHDKIRHPRPQKSHPPIKEEEGISTIHDLDAANLEAYKPYLITDWYLKNCFVDHIVDTRFDLEPFQKCTFAEYGDFANQPFELIENREQTIGLEREGGIYIDTHKHPATLQKFFTLEGGKISFDITLDTEVKDLFYLMEHNLHFADSSRILIDEHPFSDSVGILRQQTLSIYDPYTEKTLLFAFSRPVEIYICRLDTLSQSEAGFELTNQGISFGFKIPLSGKSGLKGSLEII